MVSRLEKERLVTLSISAINKDEKRMFFLWSTITAGCLIFAEVYKQFGHGVTSDYMRLMFLYPLILGIGEEMILVLRQKTKLIKTFAMQLYSWGIVTLIMGNLLRGVFDIAGTSSNFVYIYWIIGCILIAVGVIGLHIDKMN